MEIANFTSDVRFLSGAQNSVADILSRPPPEVLGKVYQLPAQEERAAAIDAVAREDSTDKPDMDDTSTETTFETISAKELAQAQLESPEVVAHRAGQHPRSVSMADVEFTPGQVLFCEIASGKARPFVPLEWRKRVFTMFHSLNHPGPKPTVKKVESRYY